MTSQTFSTIYEQYQHAVVIARAADLKGGKSARQAWRKVERLRGLIRDARRPIRPTRPRNPNKQR